MFVHVTHPTASSGRRWTRAIALVGIAVLGLIPLAPSESAGATVSVPRVWLCAQTLATRPRTIVIACADANTSVTDLHWTSWGGSRAEATGRYVWNDCVPYCAAGHLHSRAVRVRLYGLHNGVYHFLSGIGDSLGGASPVHLLAPRMLGTWHVSVGVGASARCAGGTRSAQTCALHLPATAPAARHEKFSVVLHNPTTTRWCVGLAISSSVAAGLRSLCAAPRSAGRLDLFAASKVYSRASVNVFVVGASERAAATHPRLAKLRR